MLLQSLLYHLFVVFLIACLRSSDALYIKFSSLSIRTLAVSSKVRCMSTFETSPAIISIQESEIVRRILQQRATRGRVRPVRTKQSDARTLAVSKDVVELTLPRHQTQPQPRTQLPKTIKIKKAPRPGSTGRTVKGFELPYESTIKALRVYYKENSSLALPRRFVVPEMSKYPKEWHGIDLAGTVYDMMWWQRHVKQRPERVIELTKMGFIWERLQPEWNLVLEALITYRSIYGNLLVPAQFTVPYGDERWPKATWGSSLGNSVYRIRNRGDFLQGSNAWSRRDQLDSIGFVWDVYEQRFRKFYKAVQIYGQLASKKSVATSRPSPIKVPSTYVVPESPEWPKELWGYQLGRKCSDVRQKEVYVKGHPERLKLLADVGFYIGGNDSLKWLEVVHAAAVYSQMHQKVLDVPVNFVVPAPQRLIYDHMSASGVKIVGSDDAWPWPEYLWGFPLGQRLKDIRVKGYYLRGKEAEARRRQLDALGFNWNPKRGRRRRVVSG